MDNQTNSLVQSILVSGTLCLNFDTDAKHCRSVIQKLASIKEWKNDLSKQVKCFELPMNEFTSIEDNVLQILSDFTNLKTCILVGGKHGNDGSINVGGLTSSIDFRIPGMVTTVNLCFNTIERFPKCLLHLEQIKILMLDYNSFEVLSTEFFNLVSLEELYLRNNKLMKIHQDICKLSNLKILKLSSNLLVDLPDVFHLLKSLNLLDVTDNKIEKLPKNIFASSLAKLLAGHNKLECLPENCLCSSAQVIDVRYNFITQVSNDIKNSPHILLEGNISKYTSNDSQGDLVDDYDVPIHTLETNIFEINLGDGCGGGYELPCGIKIIIPNHFSCSSDMIYCNVIVKEATDFNLRPTDQLLSAILELTPNGLSFEKPLFVSLPYTYSGFDKQKREIVMRVTTSTAGGNNCYEDLKSRISDSYDDDIHGVVGNVSAYISHFSMFAAVARLTEDTIFVDQDSTRTVISSADSYMKLYFPLDSVAQNTKVTIQVLLVSPSDAQAVLESDDYCPVGNVLHVNVSPHGIAFNQPVTVHLALPSALMGKVYNRNDLRLMKSSSDSFEWDDITDDVELHFSTVDVSFQVDSFSKFWLVWSNVCGIARKVYRRIITYHVQFLAMQKRALPSIVIAQCVRADLIDDRMKQLVDAGYSDEDACTVVQDLMEGDRFQIKVIGDIQLKSFPEADRRHIERNILIRRFHSQYPPEKSGFCKFCIEPRHAQENKTVFGHVSFYKIIEPLSPATDSGSILDVDKQGNAPKKRSRDELLNEAVQLRENDLKFLHSLSMSDVPTCHLDDVLITLKNTYEPIQFPEEKEHRLCFGELGTGMFAESNLRYIASQIGLEWEEIGHYLGIRTDDMDRMKLDYPGQAKQQIFQMLKKWAAMHMHEDNCVNDFVRALEDADRNDLAQKVLKIYADGSQNFRNSIKRRKEINLPDSFG